MFKYFQFLMKSSVRISYSYSC